MRTVSVGRGLDPKDFALVAFGGAGPLHACSLASLLGMDTIIIPPTPGVLSTYGLLFTDFRNDYVQTYVHSGEPSVGDVSAIYDRLEQQAAGWLRRESVPEPSQQISRSADLRYQHQGWEITVDVPAGEVTQQILEDVETTFHELHRRLYTYNLPHQTVELVNLRVTALGSLPRPPSDPVADTTGYVPDPTSRRRIRLSRSQGFVEAPVYDRQHLAPGVEINGPAIVEQSDTTTLLASAYFSRTDAYGNLVIRPIDRNSEG
jgi:N-methylhydantoinase A